jgi:hypothetical protein
MSDPLLPDGITVSAARTVDEKDAVHIDLGKLLRIEGLDLTVALVLPLRQAEIFGSAIIGKVMEIRRHGLRVVGDEDGA